MRRARRIRRAAHELLHLDPGAGGVAWYWHRVAPLLRQAGHEAVADAVFEAVCGFRSWPPVPIRVLAGADDRFFPVEFQRMVARDRLGRALDILPGGHLIALSQPAALADFLIATDDETG